MEQVKVLHLKLFQQCLASEEVKVTKVKLRVMVKSLTNQPTEMVGLGMVQVLEEEEDVLDILLFEENIITGTC